MNEKAQQYKSGYVAIVGAPNVGKSTLMNAFLGQKLSIVTRKPQTTRHRILGIMTDERSQMIFVDTPGLLAPKYLLHEVMMDSAGRALEDADVVLLLSDVSSKDELPEAVVKRVIETIHDKPLILALTKIDTVEKNSILPLIEKYRSSGTFLRVVPISAATGENLKELRDFLEEVLPDHPAYYPADAMTEQSERFFVAEIIREKIFDQFQEEVPYSTGVEIREFRDQEGEKTFISADVVVERNSQKGILIGKRGMALKKVGAEARKDIELLLDREVYLDLHVRVGKNWRQSPQWMKRLGYADQANDSKRSKV